MASDQDTDVSSVSDFSDYESSSSDEDENKFQIPIPSVTVIYGRSMTGKSTFVADLIVGNQFTTAPKAFFLAVPKSGIDAVDEQAKANYVKTVLTGYDPFDENPNAICITNDLATLAQAMSAQSKLPKVVILDDMLSTGAMCREVNTLVNKYMHHCNAAIFVISQNLFPKDGTHLRNIADFVVIYPGHQPNQQKLFLKDFQPQIRDAAYDFLTKQKDVEFDIDNVNYTKPVIIDRYMHQANGASGIVTRLWRDVHDASPLVVCGDGAGADGGSDGATGGGAGDWGIMAIDPSVRHMVLQQQKAAAGKRRQAGRRQGSLFDPPTSLPGVAARRAR